MSHIPRKPQANHELEWLVLPKSNLAGLVRHFGPGMILMMTGIGTSHLITAPVAGGRFAYALLWCIPIAYIFKYYGFEMAFRFTHATGRSMLDAYAMAWKRWPLWYVLITTLLQCAIGQAGRLVAAAAVLYYFFSLYLGLDIPIPIYGFLLGVLSVGIILGGKYKAVELMAKVSAGLLVLSTLAVYVVKPAPLSSMVHFFSFESPAGSWLIIAAFLGLLPTGMDVSLQASEWGKAKKVGTAKIREHLEKIGHSNAFDPFESSKEELAFDTSQLSPHALEYCRRWFKIGLWDFRLGHIVSFLMACIFLLLAAVWLYPSPVEGNAVMGEIAKIFTLSVGPWMMIIFLVGSFAATSSTAFNYFDGWPRVVGACSRNLFQPTSQLPGIAGEDLTSEHRKKWYSEFNIYRITMLYSLIAAVAMITGVPRPVWLVLVASGLAFFIAPVVFCLNLYYCFSVIPKEDKVFYPSTFATWFSWASLVVFTGLSAILIMARVFNIQLFGV
ncbi:Nramp family divalent metal transporter [Acidobacteria bacterium AH-259-D05]|nr:Nramp family divalent metal transporter [Acidobacteria bacterium AH-259-D05]